jgi:hypothetical protein
VQPSNLHNHNDPGLSLDHKGPGTGCMIPGCSAVEPEDFLSNHAQKMQWHEGDYLGTNERIRVCYTHHRAHGKEQAEAGVQAEAELQSCTAATTARTPCSCRTSTRGRRRRGMTCSDSSYPWGLGGDLPRARETHCV